MDRPSVTTVQPALARATDKAWPSPAEPPVIKATDTFFSSAILWPPNLVSAGDTCQYSS
jgi:hypothetical protein